METKEKLENPFMNELIEKTEFVYKVGDTVEGKIIAKDVSSVYIDLHPRIGVIYGREFMMAKDILRKSSIGDTISAKIISLEDADGNIDLSLQEARNASIWQEAEKEERKEIDKKTIYEVVPKDANRGGLIVEWSGLRGFLPASQLSPDHYPKALNGNKEAILNALKRLVGEKLFVKVLTANKDEGRIIFSEKDTIVASETAESNKADYKVGDVKTGVVMGVTDFGAFVKIDDQIEGLVHISQMEWSLVDDPHSLYSVGDTVKVEIIEINDEGKYSFSIKNLKPNPWEELAKNYKVGDKIRGVIIKYNAHGAFASIEEGVTGLIHVSNYENEDKLRNELTIGKSYDFTISVFDPSEQKLTLVPKDKNTSK